MASSDELLDDTNAEIPGESQDKSKTEFLNRVKKIQSEIKTKFQNARKKLDEQELKILKRVEETEKEIIDDYEKNAITLKEITQAKGQLLSSFKSNTTNILLKKNLEIIDQEIEKIKKNSKIDSTIELVWKMEQLDLSRNDMCQVNINTKSSPPKIPTNQAGGGNVFETSEPSKNISQPLPLPRAKTLKLQKTQFQQMPPLSQQQDQQLLPPFQTQNIQSNQPPYQQNPGLSPYGFVEESPFENQPIEEPKSKLEEDDENYAFSELISYIDHLKKLKVTLATADPEIFAELAKKSSSLPMQEKYKHLPIHNVISRNLSNGRDLGSIKVGFCGLFKFTFCIIINKGSTEIKQLMVSIDSTRK